MDKTEVQLDIEQLNQLLCITTRPRIKDMLMSEIKRLESIVSGNKESSASGDSVSSDVLKQIPPPSSAPLVSVTKSVPQKYYKELMTYAWDQSDKYMKIYVTLNGVHTVDKSKISAEFTSSSFSVKVDDLGGSNYVCRAVGLWGKISAAESYHKVKTDMILLMLKKEEEKKTWAYVTEREDKKKSAPKPDEKKDPNEGLMDLLKKMYDEGDDDMKRSIAKAWTESRDKNPAADI